MGGIRDGGASRRIAAVALTVGLATVGVATGPVASAADAPRSAYTVVLRSAASTDAVTAEVRAMGGRVVASHRHGVADLSVEVSSAARAELQRDPRVRFVSADRKFRAAHIDQITPRWIRRIGANVSSTASGDGSGTVSGVNVAVLDDGIEAAHEDLNWAGGVNCNSGTATTRRVRKNAGGHGTFVAGVIGALDNGIDIVGVAPGVRLHSVKVLNQYGSGSNRTVLCGLDWVIATRSDADPANDIDVVNMSLGGPGSDDGACGALNSDPVHAKICAATASGIVVVAAAGNYAEPLETLVPAAYDEVLTATGIMDSDGLPGGTGPSPDPCGTQTGDDSAAIFSNYALSASELSHVVAAPAVCITSLYPKNEVAVWNGTSFASPAVAGMVALCIAAGPCAGLTPAEIVAKIVADAGAYAAANPGEGFLGDPQNPVAGKYYGPLIHAALY